MFHVRRLVVGAWLLISSCLVCSERSSALAQGPVYRERWGYLHLENRRAELFDELAGSTTRRLTDLDFAAVTALCAAPDRGVPFTPVARALARSRGVEADPAFLLRTAICTYVLPEVVDPDARNEVGHQANFSIFLPFTVPSPGELAFELLVRDAAGDTVWQAEVTRDTAVADLRMARPRASMPAAKHPDGAYQVELRTLIDGQGPRPEDPVLRWTLHILRGYQARSEAAIATARQLREQLEPLPKALVDGLALQVERAYTGEAFAVRSDAVRQLEQLERALQNLADDKAVLTGLTGTVATALPAGDIAQPCLLRLSKAAPPRPLVVFASGAPAYDTTTSRPREPVTRAAAWLHRELGDFGVKENWQVACFGSPGGGRPYAAALLRAIQALDEVMPSGGKKPLLVCDREAAAVVALHLEDFAPHIAGVVLVGAGAIPNRVAKKLGDLPVRMVALQDYPGTRAIERMLAFVDHLRESNQPAPNLELLHQRRLPWLFGVALSRAAIIRFAKDLFREG